MFVLVEAFPQKKSDFSDRLSLNEDSPLCCSLKSRCRMDTCRMDMVPHGAIKDLNGVMPLFQTHFESFGGVFCLLVFCNKYY